MRVEFAQAMIKFFDEYPQMAFITGDLGYMALEKVQEKFGDKFINAGVAEQNMTTVAAAMAYEGFIPWVYSISPFVTLRPYEQIRNDACLHDLPVKLVGNGGGYGYGIMGATHHNIEDIGVMRILPNMRVYVPFTAADVEPAIGQMLNDPHPNYLRLNIGAKINYPVAPFTQWRKIKAGNKGVVVGTGPVVENILNSEYAEGLEVWVVSIFPISEIPGELTDAINRTKKLITIEEHTGEGGLRETLSYHLMNQLTSPIKMLSLSANGYPSGKYGDQKWHQAENKLGGEPLAKELAAFL
ncbi:MAG TPA: transketolase C-terminal domain-containing protein [Chitinophagales bacterium]|nr:transketolase C-terminal domain-containing protein [Chitinophagales bacterium]